MKRLTVLMLALTLATPAWSADRIKATLGQRGNWDTAIIHLGAKAGIFARHNIEVETVYTSGSGETPAAGDFRQRRSRLRGRHARRDGGLREGRAGAHHRRAGDRRGRLLVREGLLADQDPEGHRRQDDRVFDARLVDPLASCSPS